MMSTFYYIERMISNPSIWAAAIQELDSLQPKNYVAGSIMNLFLLTEQHMTMKDSYCHFVDLFMTASASPPDPEEIAQFRSRSGFFSDPLVPPPHKPVVFILCRHQHYFTVCFDYQSNHAWIFGQNPNPPTAGLYTNVKWDEWHGKMYWRRISALFGWQISKVDPILSAYDFKQVYFSIFLFMCAFCVDFDLFLNRMDWIVDHLPSRSPGIY